MSQTPSAIYEIVSMKCWNPEKMFRRLLIFKLLKLQSFGIQEVRHDKRILAFPSIRGECFSPAFPYSRSFADCYFLILITDVDRYPFLESPLPMRYILV